MWNVLWENILTLPGDPNHQTFTHYLTPLRLKQVVEWSYMLLVIKYSHTFPGFNAELIAFIATEEALHFHSCQNGCLLMEAVKHHV